MDINSNLLNEVIADAKAVKETALQAAIGTLKETFEPTVRRMISQKLSEEGEVEDEPEMEDSLDGNDPVVAEGEYLDDGDDGTPADTLGESEGDGEESDPDLEEVLRELDGDFEEEEEEPAEEEDLTSEGIDAMIAEMEGEEEDLTSEDIDAMIAEMEGEEEAPADDLAMENKEVVKENKKLQTHLKEAYKAITTQKNTINEVNMMNSKLLFLTKIINKHNVGPKQQVKILEAFDRCQTVREVQLTYATLAETMSKAKQRKIVESASKSAKTVRPKSLNENYNFSGRWKELAGIGK